MPPPDSGGTASKKGQGSSSELIAAFERFRLEKTPAHWAEIVRLCPNVETQKIYLKRITGLDPGYLPPEEFFERMRLRGWSGPALRDREELQPGEPVRSLSMILFDRPTSLELLSVAKTMAMVRIQKLSGLDRQKALEEFATVVSVLDDLADDFRPVNQRHIQKLIELSGLRRLAPRPPTK